MGRNLLSEAEVQQVPDGFTVENGSWKGMILEQARQEMERRRRKVVLTTVPGREEVVPAAVFEELGGRAPEPEPEPIDPRQAALDEAESLLQRAREEAETIAAQIREDAKARASLMVEKAQAEAKEILEKARAEGSAEAERLKQAVLEEGRRQGAEE